RVLGGTEMSAFMDKWIPIMGEATIETFQMVGLSLLLSVIIGIPLGVFLVITKPGQSFENKWAYQSLNLIVNIIRSIPFIILLFFMLPFTKIIAGTTIGVRGVIAPLVVYAAPYIARLIESALLEVESGIIEAYTAMGVKRYQIIIHVLLREARPAITLGLTIA